jgi:hypothetical protein
MLDQLKEVYHKDYGLGDEHRIHVVVDSLLYGVKAAAKKRRVSTTSIYKWRKDYAKAVLSRLSEMT